MFIATYLGGFGTYAPMDSQTAFVKSTKVEGTEENAIIQGRSNQIILVGDYD